MGSHGHTGATGGEAPGDPILAAGRPHHARCTYQSAVVITVATHRSLCGGHGATVVHSRRARSAHALDHAWCGSAGATECTEKGIAVPRHAVHACTQQCCDSDVWITTTEQITEGTAGGRRPAEPPMRGTQYTATAGGMSPSKKRACFARG